MKICFIGGGNMASAMIAGMVSHGYNASDIIVFDRNDKKRENLAQKYSISASKSLVETAKQADILILAIKPQGMVDLIKEIRDLVTAKQIIVTVAAGIETNAYEKLFNKEIAFVRAIPNTPSSLGYGATGVYFNDNIDNSHKELVIDIMKTMGVVTVVEDESEIDIIAAVASSGPAYYFQFMEHMINAAISRGLEKKQAEELVAQTCLGAAQMALNNDEDIATLRKNVTSKNGITFEALKVFEENDLGCIVDKAIKANINRAKELTKEFDDSL
ncbi:pyrroline-5-carboxylate reductase [Francisella sp. 19X1-34]|uniref:pyrroline-5-carboxylate reductase n=1 Tax=Francisella sp. 19X1-34 TaxID=3087177 RepID=UPI002E35BD95|nr:pyrroline-5-carboxylate reductase [Francisella sp. 19X1-34]MED7787466.1 pyrroline-5-carboxylate reductase [Francisella sp. 19X1-34]